MKTSDFDNSLVNEVSEFLQKYMTNNRISSMTADECAEILAKNKILRNDVGPRQGFNFRQMLRDGRDGKINQIEGVYQEKPRAKWNIRRVDR